MREEAIKNYDKAKKYSSKLLDEKREGFYNMILNEIKQPKM